MLKDSMYKDALTKGIVLLVFLGFLLPAQAQNVGEGIDFFENRIRPLLVKECYDCHSANAKKLKGGLRVDGREELLKGGDSGPAIVMGEPDRSLLIKAVRHVDKDLAMPRGQG